jgi:hypothetical protein
MRVGKGEKVIEFVIDSFATKHSDPILHYVIESQAASESDCTDANYVRLSRFMIVEFQIGEEMEQTGDGEPPISDDRTNGHVGNEE